LKSTDLVVLNYCPKNRFWRGSNHLWAVHKRRSQLEGEGVLSIAGNFQTREFLQIRTFNLFLT